jgi:hypothetical protein
VPGSRSDREVPWHRWSYDEEPRRATGRYCLFCGIECRRKSAAGSWMKDVEVKPPGGQWTEAPSLPPCTSQGQSVRHYRWEERTR